MSDNITLEFALEHLKNENRQVPLFNVYRTIVIDEAEYALQEVSELDHKAFYRVAIAINNKELDLIEFNDMNLKREKKLKPEVIEGFKKMMHVGRSSAGDVVGDNKTS